MDVHANKNPQCHKVAGDLNDEIRMPNETQIWRDKMPESMSGGFSGFGFRVSIGLRHSDFGFFFARRRAARLRSPSVLPKLR